MLRALLKRTKEQKDDNKGFTLVEIIVVLVILAVLAAAAIPTMVGFVQDSKVKAYVSEARALYTACQTKATEYYTSGTTAGDDIEDLLMGVVAPATKADVDLTTSTLPVAQLMTGSVSVAADPIFYNVEVGTNGKVDSVVYQVTIDGTDYWIEISIGNSSEVLTTAPTR